MHSPGKPCRFPRRVLPRGDALTLHIEEDHQQVDELLRRVDRGDDQDPARREVLERLFAALDDVRTEEDQLLRGRFAPALARVDRALGIAARWVEGRSLLCRGERAETRV